MRRLYLILFLISFAFNINEVFVFGQATQLVEKRRSSSRAYNRAISNVEDAYDSTRFDNADFVKPQSLKLLAIIKDELVNSGGDLESRIDTLENALDKIPGMLCTADEEDLNEKLIKLNIAHDDDNGDRDNGISNISDRRAYGDRVALGPELDQKEREIRQELIQAIDKVIKSKGVCDNSPSYEQIVEDR